MKVAVCVLTYQRPEGLKRLIEGLDRLTFSKCEVPSLEIVVVDNDPTGLARKFCEDIRPDLNWPLRYSIEPRRGIPYARNKAVACAQEGRVDFIAFIDDDEVPQPSWLDELLSVQRLYDADVVAGPRLAHFTAPVAPWIKEGKFFDKRRRPTGDPLDGAGTYNILVRSEVFKGMDRLFDERFGLSGGDDRDFFIRVSNAGYTMVWADEALVYEWIPESRTNLRWLLQRRYRMGNSYSLREIGFKPAIAVRASLTAEASKLIAENLVRAIRLLAVKRRVLVKIGRAPRQSITVWDVRLIRSLLQISKGAGILAGAAGRLYKEYQRIHKV